MGRPKLTNVQDKAKLLSDLPSDVTRVQVTTETGQTKWKTTGEILDTDVLVLKDDGTPFTMVAQPGRKALVHVAPINPVVGMIARQKREFIAHDPIYKATLDAPESTDVLSKIMQGLAEESASIAFERSEAERQGMETSMISNRRIHAFKALADTWLKRKEQVSAVEVDFDSAPFQAFFVFVAETYASAMTNSGLRPEMIETVNARVAAALDDPEWEAEAHSRMKKQQPR